jgi:vanillate O-demethylase monooxygenase subunit
MAFLRNAWYPAAWREELASGLLARSFLGEPVALYRGESGSAIALADMCPHRFAPLHRGKIVGDAVQCGYHGLRFGPDGQCVFNPQSGGALPRAARVSRYPLYEKHGLVWIWMGDAARADASLIPDFGFLEDKAYTVTPGHVLTMPLTYQLLLDNLLDLSHAAYLHESTLGSEAVARGKTHVTQAGHTVQCDRMSANGLPAPVFVQAGVCGPAEYVDYWSNLRWDPPANMYLDAGVVSTGQPKEKGTILSSAQLLTPESESSTHYFWRAIRNFAMQSAEVTAAIEQVIETAFRTEDEPMVAACQARMGGRDFWDLKPVMLHDDLGVVKVRRLLTDLIKQEQAASSAASAS